MELHAVRVFYCQEAGGLVELEDDVLSIVRQVKDLYGDTIRIHMDPVDGSYVFVEHCADGTERLVFATNELDARAVERLQRSDSTRRGYIDPYDQAEREQDAYLAVSDRDKDVLNDVGERLAHALRQDGAQSPMPLKVSIPKDVP
jgi:hypothetical protein